MRRIIHIAALLLVANPASALDRMRPEWAQCESDAQCVVIDNVCGRVASVNQASVEVFRADARRWQSMIKCRWSYLENRAALTAACVGSVCAVVPEPIYGYKS